MINDSVTRGVVLDLRCLQDPNYVSRGVGRHALAIVRNAPPKVQLIGLTDPGLPPIVSEARDAADLIAINAYAVSPAATLLAPPSCFVMMSPMTHDPIFPARLLSDPTLLRASVVHDFIPHHLPDRYLPGPTDRLNYAVALRWLARCNLFLPNSQSTADDLRAVLSVPESSIVVTGCPLAAAFEEMETIDSELAPRHLLVVGGGDPRKNPEVVIRAHARSPLMQGGAGIPLVVAGSYGGAEALAFRAIAVAAGGRADLIEVPGHLPEAALLQLYRRSGVVISASHAEGFSIPVIEGMAAGAACLVSDIPAHAELVTDPDCRFPADNDAALRPMLERIVTDLGWREDILARQAEVWPRFRAGAVATRFWDAVLQRLPSRGPIVLRRPRPRVAMLSPVPPDRSGVADYTAATCAELGQLVDLHVFTEATHPLPLRNVTSVRPLQELPHISAGFDRVISVVGNSHFHVRIFELLQRYGAACIAHDARMLGFYCLIGKQRALEVASQELGRAVTDAELDAWDYDEGKLEALFLNEIAASAAPAIVHSTVTAGMMKERYGVTPAYLPFSIYRPWQSQELTQACRQAARARLGVSPDEVAIVTFGFVHHTKAPEECVWALELLRGWGIPASLHFVGVFEIEPRIAGIRPLIAKLGLEPHVRFAQGYVSEQTYRDYLVGADLAVQLRTYGLGALSGAVLDCAAAGLPTVTNHALAMAVGVPDYFRSVPDALSPLLVAEALAELLDAGLAANRPEDARRAYSEQRSFGAYARQLCQVLALQLSTTQSGLRSVA